MARIGDSQENIFNMLVPSNNWKHGIQTPQGASIAGNRKQLETGTHPIRADDINELRDAFYNLAKLLSNDVAIGSSAQIISPIDQRSIYIHSGSAITQNRQNAYPADMQWANQACSFYDIAPPKGFWMWMYIGGIAGIKWVHMNGGVDDNDVLYCRMFEWNDRIRITCNNTENRGDAQINYLTLWCTNNENTQGMTAF